MIVHIGLAQGTGYKTILGIGDGLLALLVHHLGNPCLFPVADGKNLLSIGQLFHNLFQVFVVLQQLDGKETRGIFVADVLIDADDALHLLNATFQLGTVIDMDMTVEEYLKFVCEIKEVRRKSQKAHLDDLYNLVKITDVRHRLIRNLSKGYKQRVGVAQALVGNPEVVIMDEPTVGLDPIQIIEIQNLVKELGKRHTVIFSSHILSEVQTICDKILIISKGTLTALGTPAELERQLRSAGEIVLTTDAPVGKAQALLAALPHITAVDQPELAADGAVTLRLKTDSDDMHKVSRSIFFAFEKEDQALLELSVHKASLEDVFLELTESGQAEESKQYTEEPNETEVDA